ncbi:hypothetical protein GDO78_017540 [Eleutherodactylus coqui]|uniref:Uncharacterized protein n=1 Tax=Eleutherodactylus coqui TaxID=57060 RepID=A0A8J6BEV0_ELECQ|nr:hypothetical protein GDO78_017540 [Eleutherodactylus coqui]
MEFLPNSLQHLITLLEIMIGSQSLLLILHQDSLLDILLFLHLDYLLVLHQHLLLHQCLHLLEEMVI